MRGVPLTPEQLEKAAEEFRRTGSYTAAALVIGATESGTRRALIRRGESTRDELHVRAVRRGIRKARKKIRNALDASDRFLDAGDGKEFAAVACAIARLSDALLAQDERRERRRTGQLTRAKTKAEIDAIKRDESSASGSVRVVVNIRSRDGVVAGENGRTPVGTDGESG